MSTTRQIISRARRAGSIRARIILGATALVLAVVPAGVAQADWYFSKSVAQRAAIDFVSERYADTYASDLTTYCRPFGRNSADSRYVYHSWTCGWYDSSDDTSGTVRIIGSRGSGNYYGRVLVGAH